MLPTGHIEFTWAALSLAQRRLGWFYDADYRIMAAVALAPDLLDKPLALTVYRDAGAALFWGHNLWLHIAIWSAAWGVTRARTRFARILPYLLAFSGHLLADRMWGFQESLFYPLGAGYWHRWVHVGDPGAMLQAYLTVIRTTPLLVLFEVIGAALLAWFVWERRLWQPGRLIPFLRFGRMGAADRCEDLGSRPAWGTSLRTLLGRVCSKSVEG